MTAHIVLDFETRSEADLKKVGTARYAEHASTEAKMLCWAYGDEPVQRWRGDVWFEVGGWPDEPPVRLFELIRQGVLVEAHNAFFERMIWRRIMVARHGWPDIPDAQWRCSAARASACSLPRGLGDAAKAMALTMEKDTEGHKLMLRLCKPRPQWMKWRRGELAGKPEPEKYFQSLEEFERELDYCAQDVETERALTRVLPDLKPSEWQVWHVDQRMNERGIKCDVDFAAHMLTLIERYRDKMRDELASLTNGEVLKETQRRKVLDWFLRNDTQLPDDNGDLRSLSDTQAETLQDVADYYEYDDRGRVARIVRQLNKSSVSKYRAMIERASEEDGRARDTLLFHGASTGRWCLTGDHEVLTPNGWQRLDQWKGGSIACWNKGVVSFAQSRHNEFSAPETLFSMNSTRVRQLSTGEHTMPFYDTKSGAFRTSEVQKLPSRVQIPFHGQIQFAGRADPWETRMLIAVQGDGHYLEDGSIRFHMKKARKIERLRTLCRKLSIPYSEQVYNSGTVTLIPSRGVPMFLKMFSDKTFGPWIWRLDPVVFFEELVFWDGHRNAPKSFQYTTCNKTNADLIQAFAHVNGMSARVLEKHRDVQGWSTAYVVNIWETPGHAHEYRHGVEEVPNAAHQKVYCPTTPTGFFLVRREGSVWVTGNSGKGIQLQNVPGGKIKNMEEAVETAQAMSTLEDIFLEYDEPMEAFSGLIRGALTASEGKELVVADYASIEARGVMWLAQETSGLKIFQSGDCIYCDMATSVYGWKVEKAKAKAGDLKHYNARNGLGKKCLGADTVVVTSNGPKRITDVLAQDLLWDGVEWVDHEGLVCAGNKETIWVEGVEMTPDHKVMVHTGHMLEAHRALEGNMRFPKLGTPLANLLSLKSPTEPVGASSLSAASALVANAAPLYTPTSSVGSVQLATSAQKPNLSPKDGTSTRSPCLTTGTVAGCSIAWLARSADATIQKTKCTSTMACGASECATNGDKTGARFSNTSRPYLGGKIHPWTSTGSTTTATMSPATSVSLQKAKTRRTGEGSKTLRPVFDILNAGPRHRFTIICGDGSLWVVSNSILGLGYQMGPAKFLSTCEKGRLYFTDDLVDEVVPADDQAYIERDIRSNALMYFGKAKIIEPRVRPLILSKFVVERYRSKYTMVSAYWNDIEEAASAAVWDFKNRNPNRDWIYVRGYRGPGAIAYKVVGRFLFCRLPSGRHLAYPYPDIKKKKTAWGSEKWTLTFMGVDSFTHRWCEQTTYGGKLCLAGDTKVLTHTGVKSLTEVQVDDLVWDGEEWVRHEGLALNGARETISVDGVRMTPDHEVMTEEGWQDASSCGGYNRPRVRAPEGAQLRRASRGSRFTVKRTPGLREEVYDLINAGPRNRFCVVSDEGLMIVHNCENVTQAAARDIMAEALVRLDAHPIYTPVLSVHDEAVTEAPIGMGSAKELEEIMAQTPAWAKGFPIEVEGWKGLRYKK